MMPGPEEFRRDIRAAKRFGLAQGLLLLPSLFSLMPGYRLCRGRQLAGNRHGSRCLCASCRCAGLP